MRYQKYVRLLFIVPLLVVVGACDDDGISVNTVEPAALVRFVNAAPQPGVVDLRFIDQVESLPLFLEVGFGQNSGAGYQRVKPGTRHLRVFPNSTDPEVASTRLVDNPGFSLTANERVTLLLTQDGGSHQITRLADPATIERAPAGQIAVKVLHAAASQPVAVDVYVVATPVPADWRTNNAHVFTNVAYQSTTGYVNVPVLEGTSLYHFIATPAGDNSTLLFNNAPDQPGATSTQATAGPLPGVRIPESVLTAVLVPGASPSISLLIDRTLDVQ